MPRCGDCKKFVSVDSDTEPSEGNFTVTVSDGVADWEGTVEIENNCADCGTTLKNASLDVSGTFEVDLSEDYDDDVWSDFTVEVEDLQRVDKTEGSGRGTKTFYGASGTVKLLDPDGSEVESQDFEEYVQASHMDDY